ncbi:hypothetical protein D3880_04005 [Pseudomonas cavernae]|uniref:Carbon storage regulator n=1 Tax=Pseudomonas cavernae TaxID=2320867 RepID=A0A385Z059_9PSED|nr:hypothetical protein D3880_04005 [Pseudomonas cavernae]
MQASRDVQLQRDGIVIEAREIRGSKARLSFEAQREVGILREEIGGVDLQEAQGWSRPRRQPK